MGQVAVRVNGRQYQVACDDGQEDRLSELGVQVDKRIQELLAAVGTDVGEQRLLVMASLLMADELSEAQAEVDRLRGTNQRTLQNDKIREEMELAGTLELMASRIEAIADKLEAN